MLCAKCHAREATVHFTGIDGDKVTKFDLCAECAEPRIGEQKGIELGNLLEILKSGKSPEALRLKIIKAALGETMRYPIEAYCFIGEALDACCTETHVSGRALLIAIRKLALKKFGRRAKATLANWKIFRTEDFGEILFEMIDGGVLGKQPEDSKADFQSGFNFNEAFPEN